ncbi:uncharacterized protein LOC120511997 [Passer montanus]|uniref:uncharacterized protein LOC120511997 n=1 Tax=Passer montanus TaxID=9160 RepID=UPI00195F5680|nr:uncharacterized protein LOC120511997 [Passer montanus]
MGEGLHVCMCRKRLGKALSLGGFHLATPHMGQAEKTLNAPGGLLPSGGKMLDWAKSRGIKSNCVTSTWGFSKLSDFSLSFFETVLLFLRLGFSRLAFRILLLSRGFLSLRLFALPPSLPSGSPALAGSGSAPRLPCLPVCLTNAPPVPSLRPCLCPPGRTLPPRRSRGHRDCAFPRAALARSHPRQAASTAPPPGRRQHFPDSLRYTVHRYNICLVWYNFIPENPLLKELAVPRSRTQQVPRNGRG